uniref:Uncharacterized protein n=1 Tax=Arundo donax TaxID=35708 RepID=A0A0A8Z8J9_ARUDO
MVSSERKELAGGMASKGPCNGEQRAESFLEPMGWPVEGLAMASGVLPTVTRPARFQLRRRRGDP